MPCMHRPPLRPMLHSTYLRMVGAAATLVAECLDFQALGVLQAGASIPALVELPAVAGPQPAPRVSLLPNSRGRATGSAPVFLAKGPAVTFPALGVPVSPLGEGLCRIR